MSNLPIATIAGQIYVDNVTRLVDMIDSKKVHARVLTKPTKQGQLIMAPYVSEETYSEAKNSSLFVEFPVCEVEFVEETDDLRAGVILKNLPNSFEYEALEDRFFKVAEEVQASQLVGKTIRYYHGDRNSLFIPAYNAETLAHFKEIFESNSDARVQAKMNMLWMAGGSFPSEVCFGLKYQLCKAPKVAGGTQGRKKRRRVEAVAAPVPVASDALMQSISS